MTLPNLTFPQTGYNFVDENGAITAPWLQFLQQLYFRTGGSIPDIPGDTGIQGLISALSAETVSQNDVEGSTLIGLTEHGFPETKNIVFPFGVEYPSAPLKQQDPVLMATALESGQPTGDTSRSYATKTIAVGASPYSYTAPSNGSVFVTGGTVSAIAFSRDGTTFLSTGLIAGIIPVRKKDIVRVTYTAAPTMTFVPM